MRSSEHTEVASLAVRESIIALQRIAEQARYIRDASSVPLLYSTKVSHVHVLQLYYFFQTLYPHLIISLNSPNEVILRRRIPHRLRIGATGHHSFPR